MNLKKILLASLCAICSIATFAQSAQQVLDKTAAIVGKKSGASANFSISSAKYGSTSGTVSIKGNKFNARTPQSIVWYDGKTQWSYMKKTNEVNVSTPTQAQQMSMNPYTFINIYKTGYKMDMKTSGNNYEVHLVAQNTKRSITEMYITITRSSYVPSKVRMKQGKSWSTITISNFQQKSLPNSTFTFKSKDFPSAEVIDLR